ncbi:hypothetical protein [Gordonia asplenii]|uniref:hypothetical protein n=1 Tax=Gordonia asplenii TaxID=2725283 RepID=UPI0035E44A2C
MAQIGGVLTGGLNLYGNGFAAGLVAAVVGPVALMLGDRRASDTPSERTDVPAA